MMRLLVFILFLPFPAFTQCLSGNCREGFGKFDYGYAVYEGEFKNDKPHGKGTMDYGGGDKYSGNFINGKEDGEGVLYKAGKLKEVRYKNGMLQEKTEPVVIGGNNVYEQDINCIGDCINGFGTMKFPSGNVYAGNFKNGKFHGKGKMQFASGNVLNGMFEDHFPVSGTFVYANDATVFKGSFNKDGTPASGTYSSKETGGVVEVSNGEITKVSNPRLDSIRAAQPKYANVKCSYCKGTGFTTTTSTSYEQLTPNVYQAHSSGFASLVSQGQSLKTKHTSQSKCRQCSGQGTTSKKVN